ncbi:hypothetical protein HPB52_014744 [Rhipicephalus sanguineus]|uniref:Uncharacterized protein n=1 Tax=Rhipicephalus sanguineus TaxID=34632 RepID=A0A9D4PL02_RHISA|nr:hypothetical protein HPB52_014744 [Rhipicephalus sanguineus]
MVSSLISQCTTGTMALRELEVICRLRSGNWYADHMFQKALVEAVSVNSTIRSLYIWGMSFDETEAQTLADALLSSQTLYQFCFQPHDQMSIFSFLRELSLKVSSNYVLLRLYLTAHFDLRANLRTVAKVVHRNNSLVTRATHFVMGTRHKYCAAAFELVHSTPGLVARVQNYASVDEDEAVQRIRRSLNGLCELDGFMRVTGVVKDSVTCHRREDGVMQLTDLNTDCWLHVRQHLKVSDIPDVM